jgi:hypothetical protein
VAAGHARLARRVTRGPALAAPLRPLQSAKPPPPLPPRRLQRAPSRHPPLPLST